MSEIRVLAARAAAHSSWAQTSDRSARTKPARDRFAQRFLDQVDPNRELPEAERLRRAESARKAYFADLARRSAAARKSKRAGSPAPSQSPTPSTAKSKGSSHATCAS